jgi:ankyrin repeat protein
MEEEMVINAAISGHMDIIKYLVEERKIAGDAVKIRCVSTAAMNGRLDCLKYLIEDAKAPLNDDDDGREHLSFARYYERTECVNYLREKGCPEPTEEEYAEFVEDERERVAFYEREEERQSNTSSD